MSTKLTDIPTQAAYGITFAPAVRTASANGTAVDLGDGDGPGFAILLTGTVAAGTTVAVALEESDDQSSWDPIADAEFPDVSSSNQKRAIRFQRSRRYVRAALTISGSSPSAGTAAIVGQQKKTF
jgi:hypothetical protein